MRKIFLKKILYFTYIFLNSKNLIRDLISKYIIFFSYEKIKYKKLIKKYKKILANKEILDVGCGYGVFSYHISFYAKSVDALDIDLNVIKNALKHNNINYFNIDIENYKTKKKYDFIICSHVLEHIKNDKKVFRKITELLRKGGYILLSTPNKNKIISYNFRLSNFLKKFFKKNFSEILKEKPHNHEREGYSKEDFINIKKNTSMEIVDIFYDKSSLILYEIFFLLPIYIRIILLPIFSFLEYINHKFDDKDGMNIYVLFRKKSKKRKKRDIKLKTKINLYIM
ncbi:MAG: class I SAM-dependent methyltransferase [Candidatus Aenigmatarchaeota archaeon]